MIGVASLGLLLGSGVPSVDGAVPATGACPDMPTGNPSPPAAIGATDILSFDAGSLIIPMDSCYQRPSFMSDAEVDDIIGDGDAEICNSNSEKDDGIIPAYTLMFRLIEADIPVHWSIKAAKTDWHDVDFSVLRGAGAPVAHYEPGGTLNTTKYSAISEIKYRGAPFIIAQEHAADALALMDSVDGTCETGTCYGEVDIHIAQADFDAPIYQEIGALPKIAVLDVSDAATDLKNEKTSFLAASIKESLMADLEGTVFTWLTITDVNNGDLISGGYDLAWIPPFELDDGVTATAAQQTFIGNLSAYADAGGSILFQDGAIAAMEGYGTYLDPGYSQTQEVPTGAGFQTTGGLHVNGVSATYDNGDDNELTVSEDYSDPASQFGGMVWTGIGGSKYNWTPRCDGSYRDGTRRMIYTDHQTDNTQDNWDIASWRRKDNDPNKGVIYYLGGSNWRRVTASGFRILMNTVLAESTAVGATGAREVARSGPIIATVGESFNQYAGTFETDFSISAATTFGSVAADETTFDFPDVRGHYRAMDLSKVPDGDSNYAALADIDGAILFDAATILPTMTINTSDQGCNFPADGTCRRIFTNQGIDNTTRVPITLGNRAELEDDLGFTDTEADWLIQRVHQGANDGAGNFTAALGGLDRSTAAIIEASPVVGGTRPTVAYVGGTDGMLHAFCADTVDECPAVGTELWAFMPRTELGKVALNTTRIDGSPKVADVFGDFGAGTSEYRTVLAFQNGNSNPSATYGLDITDPANPAILWEYSSTGGGTTLAMATVLIQGRGLVHATFLQTSSGTATAGMEVTAIETASGEVLWTQSTAYPATRATATADIPSTAFPGGVTVFASEGGDIADTVLVPTLWGSVHSLDASTGTDKNSGDPIFQFSEDYHPIGAPVSIYRGQDDFQLHAVVVTGGFTDSESPSATSWAPSDVNQYAVGFLVDHTGTPVTEVDVAADPNLGIFIDFGAGNRAFSQAVIAGNEIFIATDTADVNAGVYGSGSTGSLFRSNLSSGGTTQTTISSGAGAPDVSATTGTVYTGGGGGVQVSTSAGFDANGTAVEASAAPTSKRFLWLRTQ